MGEVAIGGEGGTFPLTLTLSRRGRGDFWSSLAFSRQTHLNGHLCWTMCSRSSASKCLSSPSSGAMAPGARAQKV
ncbi:hypothetical protein GMST_12600 [Geomonas silvestris]|uniref:Uncharacterized protein n=1 Tax=Geomonas silvestris TaxID=2740184 RepID=A0A6V8MG37_9BACT|nr:hypothetical protein GMST_12600 [Geomonas silvestris]